MNQYLARLLPLSALVSLKLFYSSVKCTEKNVREINTPAVNMLLDRIRQKEITTAQYRRLSRRIFRLLIEESLAEDIVQSEETCYSITGGEFKPHVLKYAEEEVSVVSIMRSADSMLDQFMHVVPDSKVGKILVQRQEASKEKSPLFYYSKLPPSIGSSPRVFLLDPMLGTGGSASTAIEKLKESGVAEERIVFINLISCPDGIAALGSRYPGVRVITGKIDPILNEQKYIVPGLGDYGDRYFASNK